MNSARLADSSATRSPRCKPRRTSARATPFAMASSCANVNSRGRPLAAEIDDRDLGEIAIAPDQIAEIAQSRHYGSRDSRYAASAIMSLCDKFATDRLHEQNADTLAGAGLNVVELAEDVRRGPAGDAGGTSPMPFRFGP